MDAKSPPKSRAPYVAWMLTMFFRAEDDIKGGRSSPRFTSAELKDIKEIGQSSQEWISRFQAENDHKASRDLGVFVWAEPHKQFIPYAHRSFNG